MLKRLATGVLAVAVIVGAAFAFTGCGKLNGKTYAYEGESYTIITKIEEAEDGTITVVETQELSIKEFYLYAVKGVELEDLADYEMTDLEEEALEEYIEMKKEIMEGITVSFSGKTCKRTTRMTNEITGEYADQVNVCKYSEKDGVYTVEATSAESESDPNYTVTYSTFKLAEDGKLHQISYNEDIEENADLEVGALYYTTYVYAEIAE